MKPKLSTKADEKKGLVLICDACGYENEPQRIYCHNCGAKLDRNKLPSEKETKPETIHEIQRRHQRAAAAQSFMKGIGTFVGVVILAVITACVVLLFKPPDDLPAVPNQDALLDAPMITVDLQGVVSHPTLVAISYTEEQVNGFLMRGLRSGASSRNKEAMVKLERALAGFEPGQVRVVMTVKVYVVPITVQSWRRVELAGGTLSDEVVGLQFGSLPIHPAAAPVLKNLFGNLWRALDQEKRLVERLESMVFEEKRVVLSGGGSEE